jgi:hypothetical protein
MQAQRIVDGAAMTQSPDSTRATLPTVPARSARRATARRASNRRATARERKGDVEGRIVEFLRDHPRSTTGDIAKGLNANRATIAAGLSHIAGPATHRTVGGRVAMAHTLSHRGTSEERAAGQEVGRTITAALDDGPLRGQRIQAQVVEGRPPSTVDVPADDGSRCRYCLAEWVQSGPSAVYTFLYRV